MKNIIAGIAIIAIGAYIFLNYQYTSHRFYNEAEPATEGVHRALLGKMRSIDRDFLLRDGFNIVDGKGTVLQYGKLVKKATPNVNDDTVSSFMIFLPIDDLNQGDRHSISMRRGTMVFYVGGSFRYPCFGYGSHGSVNVTHKGPLKLEAEVIFSAQLRNIQDEPCDSVEFNETVTFEKAYAGDTWDILSTKN